VELDEEYPKTCRKRTARIKTVLEAVPELNAKERERIALSLNQMADKARDLDDIMDRLLNEPHSMTEIGELLIALEMTAEQIRGHSDVVDGKLHDIGERLKSLTPAKSA
jgi:K+/H+ antiporter YhaU regulatory subunit KhtT